MYYENSNMVNKVMNEESIDRTPALQRLITKLTKENLWLYVIRVLKESPMYAYEVKVHITNRMGIKVSTVAVYTVLYKMTREGLLERFTGSSGRSYYRVTEKGIKAYEKAIRVLEDVISILKGEKEALKLSTS